MSDIRNIRNWRRRRDAVLRNPTTAGAMQFWDFALLGQPVTPDAPLACIHKARLQWPDATPVMVAESRRWLAEHGYGDERNSLT